MQQTEKYKLNLIDPEDEFSPEPLNRNAETVETQFQAREAAEAALQTAIGSGGSNARIAWGSFAGGSGTKTLTFDFRPIVVAITSTGHPNGLPTAVLVRDATGEVAGTNANAENVAWTDNGVRFSGYYNVSGRRVYYAAIGVSQ